MATVRKPRTKRRCVVCNGPYPPGSKGGHGMCHRCYCAKYMREVYRPRQRDDEK